MWLYSKYFHSVRLETFLLIFNFRKHIKLQRHFNSTQTSLWRYFRPRTEEGVHEVVDLSRTVHYSKFAHNLLSYLLVYVNGDLVKRQPKTIEPNKLDNEVGLSYISPLCLHSKSQTQEKYQ